MSVKIPKISLGVGNRSKSKLNFSNTSSGSTTWGHMLVPYSCYLDAGDTVHYKDGNFTRLFPLVAPTFSRSVKMRFFAQFVPDADLLENFENMMTGTVFAPGAGNASYIPKNTLVANLKYLTEYVLYNSVCRVYTGEGGTASQYYTSFVPVLNAELTDALVGFNAEFSYFSIDSNKLRIDSVSPDNYDFLLHIVRNNNHYFAFFKFTAQAHRFVSILNQLGYQLDFKDTEKISVLPLFSYYKAWFDSNFVQRRLSWTQSFVFEFLHYHCVKGSTHFMDLTTQDSSVVAPVFDLISNCYYSYDPDYFSMQLDNATLEFDNSSLSSASNDITFYPSDVYNGAGTTSSSSGINLPQAFVHNGAASNINRWQLQLVNALTKYIDKRSVVGQNIANLMAAHGYGDVCNFRDSYVLGSWDFDLQVSDVTATAAGTGSMGDSFLGEYTGKSQGQGGSPSIKFTADKPGMFIILMCVVPDLEYVCGVQPYLYSIDRFSKYNTEFDSLGRVSTRKAEFLTNRDYSGPVSGDFVPDIDTANSFGLVPRYAGLKVKQSTISGLLYNHSSRDQFAPYTLSRLIAPTSSTFDSVRKVFSYEKINPGNVVASDELRYCGKQNWLGNFDRIFVDGFIESSQFPVSVLPEFATDHFIFHSLNDVTLYSVKKSLGHSFDTDAGGYELEVEQQ